MSALAGFDQYSGSVRRVAVEPNGPHVLLRVEGAESDGAVMLTPEQVGALVKLLHEAAASTAVGYADWPPS